MRAFRAAATRRDPDASPLPSLHPRTIGELICVGRSTRRTDTYPPLSQRRRHYHSNVMCAAYPSSPLYNNNIISYTRHRESTRWQTFGTQKNEFLFRPTALCSEFFIYLFFCTADVDIVVFIFFLPIISAGNSP